MFHKLCNTQYSLLLVDIFCMQASIRAFKLTSLSPGSSPSSLSRSVSIIFLLHTFQNYQSFNWFCVSFTTMCCNLIVNICLYIFHILPLLHLMSLLTPPDVSMAYFPPQVYVPCVMTVSVSWMSFWLDHKAVRKRCLANLITSTLVPENVSRFPILSKTSYCAGARESCPRGDHSAGNVHNSGLDILQTNLLFIPGISNHITQL